MNTYLTAQPLLAATLGCDVLSDLHAADFSASLIQAQAPREFKFSAGRHPIDGMRTVDDSRRQNLTWLATQAGGVRQLSARLEKSESQVSQWMHGHAESKTGKPRGMRSSSCRDIEVKLSLPPGWMDEQHSFAGEEPGRYEVARLLSYPSVEDAPLLTWGADMLDDGMALMFWVALPDDSMAPRAPKGKLICFDTRLAARPGDGVIVRDKTGGLHFRVYRPGAAGRFAAHALNADFAALDSERDGLRVVAVLMSEEGRWGST